MIFEVIMHLDLNNTTQNCVIECQFVKGIISIKGDTSHFLLVRYRLEIIQSGFEFVCFKQEL